jgi:predicted branched-subunit amino acid permease
MQLVRSAFGMDGRLATVLLAFVLPAILIGVTAVYFASNPVSILVLVSVMVVGALNLVSYTEVF